MQRQDKALVAEGYSIAEAILPKVQPANVDQRALFDR
jgi:hypothetical protein